ncbi:IS701 family transposase [Actinoplanes sp. NPDC049668]|uniref:IS701 family transposase n=1 Tax=unclassified Actinoplanes TaxID=2626549 RepID=UPI0033A60D92
MDTPLFDVICGSLFDSMSRSDQRSRGHQYLRGILQAEGRKTVRNIAAALNGEVDEQSLHHFVANSPWDWRPVRRSFAHAVTRLAPPTAWVVRPLVIPKMGDCSVGTDPLGGGSGGRRRAQRAVGVWAVGAEVAYPVNWRLHLSSRWTDDQHRRSRAAIPADVDAESFEECVVEAVLTVTARWGMPPRPVVADVPDEYLPGTIRRLHAAGLPFLAKVPSAFPAGADTTAQHRIAALRAARRPVGWDGPGSRTDLVASADIRSVNGRQPLTLLGSGRPRRVWPEELHVTNLGNVHPATLLALSRLRRAAYRGTVETGRRVGLADFVGRSFGGWHRHVTLASAAYALLSMGCRP